MIAIRRPAVPLVELRLRVPFAQAPTWPGATCSARPSSPVRRPCPPWISRPSCRRSAARSAPAPTPTGCSSPATRSPPGCPGCWRSSPTCSAAPTTRPTRWPPSATRLVDRIQIASSQPGHLVRVALLKRVYGSHPYAVQTPDRRAGAGGQAGRPAHAARRAAAPGRGDPGGRRRHRPGRRRSTRSRRRSAGGPVAASTPSCRRPRRCRPGPDRCWSTGPARCSRRCGMALPAVGRTHPDFAALQLANLVFGGYFSSRWVENIREDKGYTYSPHSAHRALDRRLDPVARRRRGHRGDRARRCWRPGTSSGRMASLPPEARTSWSRPGSTRSARCCSACRPRPGSPGWPAPTPATGCGLDYLVGYAAALASVTARRRGRCGREVPGAVRRGDRDPRRRGEGRGAAGRARAGRADGSGVTDADHRASRRGVGGRARPGRPPAVRCRVAGRRLAAREDHHGRRGQPLHRTRARGRRWRPGLRRRCAPGSRRDRAGERFFLGVDTADVPYFAAIGHLPDMPDARVGHAAGGRARARSAVGGRAGHRGRPRQLARPAPLLADDRCRDDGRRRWLDASRRHRKPAVAAHRSGGHHARARRRRGRGRPVPARPQRRMGAPSPVRPGATPAWPASWSPASRPRRRSNARCWRRSAYASPMCATWRASRGRTRDR